MKILVVGSGAREHAICDALSSESNKIFCAPGNDGMKLSGINVAKIDENDFDGLVNFAIKENIAYINIILKIKIFLTGSLLHDIKDTISFEGLCSIYTCTADATWSIMSFVAGPGKLIWNLQFNSGSYHLLFIHINKWPFQLQLMT